MVKYIISLCFTVLSSPAYSQNIMIIILDDIGVDRVGTYGHSTAAPTPNIDALAQSGVMFDRFWAYPSCSPFRASVLTGTHPFRHGVGRPIRIDGSIPEWYFGLDEAAENMAHVLKANGYRTAAVGKWHMAGADKTPSHPLDAGFDYFSGSLSNPPHSMTELPATDYWNWEKCTNGSCVLSSTYMTIDTTDEAIQQLSGSEPYFLWVGYNAAHTPIHEPPLELHSFNGQCVDGFPRPICHKAMIEALDTELARLIAAADMSDTTIFVVGDNGTPRCCTEPPFSPEHAKSTLYEGGLNTPLIVSGQAVAPYAQGQVANPIIQATDIFNTIMDITGVLETAQDSISFLPYLLEPSFSSIRSATYAEQFGPNGGPPDPLLWERAARDEKYKLIRSTPPAGDSDEFLDLEADPFEEFPLDLESLSPEEQASFDTLQEIIADPAAAQANLFTCTEQGIRDAVELAGGPHTFDCPGPTTVITTGTIVIRKDVILDGEDALTIDGADDHRVFDLRANVTELRNLTVTHGRASDCGGGITVRGRKGLILDNVIVDDNWAQNCGGGINMHSNATLWTYNSTISNNFVERPSGEGGGIGADVYDAPGADVQLFHSTVSGNSIAPCRTASCSGGRGGGIYLSGKGPSLILVNSTVSGNTTDAAEGLGGGITVFSYLNRGAIHLVNSTIANNIAASYSAISHFDAPLESSNSVIEGSCDGDNRDVSLGGNVESPGDSCKFTDPTDQVNVTSGQLALGPLQDNSGLTETHALLPGSVAIDAAVLLECPLTDQRGAPRPEPSGAACDAGSYELGSTPPASPPPPPTRQSNTQRICIKIMNGEAVKVGDAQGKESVKCQKLAARGSTDKLGIPPQAQTAQACLTNDVKGRVRKKVSKLADRDESKCLAEPQQLPDFGYAGATGAGLAVLGENLGLTADLFGPDLDAALVLKDQDKVGAKCQEVVHGLSHRVFKAVAKEVQKNADHSLRGRFLLQAYSAVSLSRTVRHAIEGDAKRKIAKAESKLTDKAGRTCEGDLTNLFPGTCSDRAGTASNLAECANEVARCRACKAAEGFGALTLDCDGFDNGLADSSCQ
jgi:arylsulfatase B